jgi:lipopolysaccharide export system permease protein
LLRPFLACAAVVSLLVAVIAASVSPRSLRELRDWAAQVRADILTNIVQPGRSTTVGGSLSILQTENRCWSGFSSTIGAIPPCIPPISPSRAKS